MADKRADQHRDLDRQDQTPDTTSEVMASSPQPKELS